MSGSPRFEPLRSFWKLGALLMVVLVCTPPAFADLPGSVASRVKKIEKSLDAADAALEMDRLQTAQRKLKDTERPLKEIQDRYAGKFDEDDPVYAAMVKHLAATTARVRAAEEAAADTKRKDADAKGAREALCKEWIDKLGPFVKHGGEQYLRIGAELNRATEEEQDLCWESYASAKTLFAAYQKVEFPLGKTQELKNVESSLASAMKYYGRDETRAAQDAACKPWVDRLAPYVDVGMNSDRRLIAAATVDAREIEKQQGLFEEAKAVFAVYQKADLPLGKSFRLQTLEDQMTQVLEEFPKAMAESQAMMSGDVGERINRLIGHLDRDTAWQSDPGRKPRVLMERDLEPLREAVDKYAGTVPPDDAKLAALRQKLQDIDAQNAKRRAICAQRTFQRATAYAGSDRKTLEEKARETAAEAHPGAEVHRITVPSPDWAVEEVVEFTDTSRTALRYRVTRSVRAEVSLRAADGKVWLQEVYLGQDQLPDGGWGTLKAHTTWADAMAAENLGKTVTGEVLG